MTDDARPVDPADDFRCWDCEVPLPIGSGRHYCPACEAYYRDHLAAEDRAACRDLSWRHPGAR